MIRKTDTVVRKQTKPSTRGVIKKIKPRGEFEIHPNIKCKITRRRVKGIQREVKLVILSAILCGIGYAIIKLADWYGFKLKGHVEQKFEIPEWAEDAMK